MVKQYGLTQQSKKSLLNDITDKLQDACNLIRQDIINELPNGSGSSIADDLYVLTSNDNKVIDIRYYDRGKIWSYLNFGTGIYAMRTQQGLLHIGQGMMGRIVPINSKALRFKSAKIARALGVTGDIVYLKSVKGIKGRRYFERHVTEYNINNKLSN